jgi:hypothetical protein
MTSVSIATIAVLNSSKVLEQKMANPSTPAAASKFIDERIANLNDWRGKTFAKVRELIHVAAPKSLKK